MQPTRQDVQTQVKPVSKGAQRKFTVTTPHGEITRTTGRDYRAIAYSVREGKVSGVSFASTLQGAYKAACGWKACGWKAPEAYYGLMLLPAQPSPSN